jgi:hypothetical protein
MEKVPLNRLQPYADWLKNEGYQESTINATLRHLRLCHGRECCEPHTRRYLRYVSETRKNPLGREFLDLAMKAGYEASADRRRSGGRVKDALSEANWARLKAKLRRGDEISWMLVAYMQSAYRIGQFLKLSASKVDETDIDDKISLDWVRTASDGEKLPLYKILCKTERCAYYRMRRRLLETCEKLGIAADFDTLYKSFHGRSSRIEAA